MPEESTPEEEQSPIESDDNETDAEETTTEDTDSEQTPTQEETPTDPQPEDSSTASETLEDMLQDGTVTEEEVAELVKTALADGVLTAEEKEIVVESVIAQFADAPAVPVSALAEAGLTLEDLPDETPVETREDENGNPVIITAEVAVALQLLESPMEMLTAIFESPAQLIFALGNLGADMSPQEREEATKTIIAATIVGNIATTTMATAVGGIGYRRP